MGTRKFSYYLFLTLAAVRGTVLKNVTKLVSKTEGQKKMTPNWCQKPGAKKKMTPIGVKNRGPKKNDTKLVSKTGGQKK
jgi:hypothetical protein